MPDPNTPKPDDTPHEPDAPGKADAAPKPPQKTLRLDVSGLREAIAAMEAERDTTPAPEDVAYLHGRLFTGDEIMFALQAKRVVVGRGRNADLRLPENLRWVSNAHFAITRTADRYEITDLDSTNGTYLNNKRLDPNTPTRITDDGIIRIGDAGRAVSIGLTFNDPTEPGHEAGYVTGASTSLKTERVRIGRAADCDIVLDAPSVHPHHATVIGGAAVGGHMLSVAEEGYALAVNNQPVVDSVQLQPGDTIRIASFLLKYDGEKITQYDSAGYRVDVVGLYKDVSVRGGEKRILHDINLTVMPREFVALVGGSGAGKSTLLDALNGLRPATGGHVYINGEELYANYDTFRNELGYVPQYDILPLGLRVGEAMRYAAELRLPPDVSVDERTRRITDALETVNMNTEAIRNTRIRNLSGGQRKRVSIAAELVSDPRLLFLDEPTSGLDPGLEKKMMYTLRRMADEGRTIILITHATSNIVQCDQVAFLAQGNLVYFGPPTDTPAFFEVEDFADIYDSIDQHGEHWRGVFEDEKPAHYARYVAGRTMSTDTPAAATPAPPTTARTWSTLDDLRQFWVLSRRMFAQIWARPITVFMMLLVMPLVAVLQMVTAEFYSIIGDPDILSDPAAAAATLSANYVPTQLSIITIFGMALLAVIVGAFGGSHELIQDRSVYLRERMIHLKIVPYLASKMFVFGGFALVQTLLYLTIYSIGVSFAKDGVLLPVAFVEIWLTLFITVLVGLCFGLLISSLSPSVETALYAVLVLVFVQYLYAGAVRDVSGSMTSQVISVVTPSRWALAGIGTTAEMNELAEATIYCGENTIVRADGTAETVTACQNVPLDTGEFFIWFGEDGGELLQIWGILALVGVGALGLTYVFVRRLDGREIRLA
jgi:ABC transport system ATP-binding/permease protein